MIAKRLIWGLLIAVATALSACAAPATPAPVMQESPTVTVVTQPTAEAMMAMPAPTGEAMVDEMDDDMAMTAPGSPVAEATTEQDETSDVMAPGWFLVDLVDVNTGESFRIADLGGKVVLVETMAVWCSNCLRQQREIVKLHAQLGDRDDYLSLALAIDPNETADILKGHAAKHGFEWRYAVSPAAVSREIATLYGDQFLNPPSTPMLIIDRTGAVHPLPFGVKSSEQLADMLQPFLAGGM